MKIMHLSDSHIGYSTYNKLDDNGYNQREVDVQDAFARMIDIAIEEKPDLVLHSGDLFDTVRPTNRAISFALEQILRLSKADIPLVMIAGNHEAPKLRETGSVFRLFEHIDSVFPVYKSKLETLKFGELLVHALPHCIDKAIFDEELKKLKPDKKFKHNIAMLHAGVAGLSVFKTGEFNEQLAQSGNLHKDFDYIALGHYHEHCEVTSNAVYAGSTERLGFGEVGQEKGFIMLDLDIGKWKFHSIEVREMRDIGPIKCQRLKSSEIMEAIEKRLARIKPEGLIIRLKLVDIDPGEYHILDTGNLKKKLKESLHFEIKADLTSHDQAIASGDAVFDSLEKEFAGYIEKKSVEGIDKEKLRTRGLEYIRKAGGDE